MADFSNSKVGDDVYSLRHGYGTINCTQSDYPSWPIRVKFSQGDFLFDTRGHYGDHKTPDLYHSKPEIIEQKRVVTKTINAFLNQDQTLAALHKDSWIDAIPCTITFQIEE